MTPFQFLLDWVQVVFATLVLIDTYRKIRTMTKTYNGLRPFEKQLLTIREEIHYSAKAFLIARSFVVLFFLIFSVDWALSGASARLTTSEDLLVFVLGMLICLNWLKGSEAQMIFFSLLTKFREKEPPCGVEKCPVEKLGATEQEET